MLTKVQFGFIALLNRYTITNAHLFALIQNMTVESGVTSLPFDFQAGITNIQTQR